MFDEQPDGDPHGECAAEIHRLQAALRNIADFDGWSFSDRETVYQMRVTAKAALGDDDRTAGVPVVPPAEAEVMRRALSALEKSLDNFPANVEHRQAIDLLRRALAAGVAPIDEREQFEDWSRSRPDGGFTLDRYSDPTCTDYIHWGTQLAWESWQASASRGVGVRELPREGDAPLSDFAEGQWWVQELDAMVASGTLDQKRAVAVVHHMLRAAAGVKVPGAAQLLGIVRTAKAEAARLIAGDGDAAELAQTRRDLPLTLAAIEHALTSGVTLPAGRQKP